jgi:hypothetical protein
MTKLCEKRNGVMLENACEPHFRVFSECFGGRWMAGKV